MPQNKSKVRSSLQASLPLRIKINIAIFAFVTLVFAIAPSCITKRWVDSFNDRPEYAGQSFSYIMNDICPCHTGEDDCSGFYACGKDKANITYNLDTAPEDLLKSTEKEAYLESLIESNRQSIIYSRIPLVCDICYIIAFISLMSGIVYWNHSKSIFK